MVHYPITKHALSCQTNIQFHTALTGNLKRKRLQLCSCQSPFQVKLTEVPPPSPHVQEPQRPRAGPLAPVRAPGELPVHRYEAGGAAAPGQRPVHLLHQNHPGEAERRPEEGRPIGTPRAVATATRLHHQEVITVDLGDR